MNGDSVKFYGIYRGIVMKNKDPEGHRRVQVKIPQLGGGDTLTQDWPWAWPLFTPGQRPYTPEVGEGVWIQFESGDPAYPIWIGSYGKNLKENKHISIKPLPDTTVTTDISTILKIDRQNDGTKEVDLTTTVVNLSNQHFCGSFYSTQIQNGGGGVPITFNTTDISKGVRLVSNSRITFDYVGIYNVAFSAQLEKTDSGTDSVEIWLRQNGTDVPWSGGIVELAGNNAKSIAAWNYLVEITVPGQYVELMWYSADPQSRLYAQVVGSRPAVPSIILTANQCR